MKNSPPRHQKERHYEPRHRRVSSAPRFWSAIATGAGLAIGAGLLAASTAGAVQGSPVHAHYQLADHRDGSRGGVLGQLTAVNDCTLKVPQNPLSAGGLATPYVLASGNDGTSCSEFSPGTAAFVQATIFDPSSGKLAVYNPVVRDAGAPLTGALPPRPHLPWDAVITIWTGFNGNVLKLTGPGAGSFVNFAQQSYASSPRFFRELREAGVTPPPLGTAKDGLTCPSTRDFTVVDQDQSDNNVEAYPAYGVSNGSDEALMGGYIYPAIGCSPWTVPLISGSPGDMSTSGPLQEYQAAADQAAPIALVPGLDDFVTAGAQGPVNGGTANLFLQNLYRAQVGQPYTSNGNDTAAYCLNMAAAVPRLKALAAFETGPPPPFAQLAPTLAGTIQVRFEASWQLLTCQALTGMASPY